MDFSLQVAPRSDSAEVDYILVSAFQQKAQEKTKEKNNKEKGKSSLDISHWDKSFQEAFSKIKNSKKYKGDKNESFIFHLPDGRSVFVWGLGEKKLLDVEGLRKSWAQAFKILRSGSTQSILINIDHFNIVNNISSTTKNLTELFFMTNYTFDKYFSEKPKSNLQKVIFYSQEISQKKNMQAAFEEGKLVGQGIVFTRDLVNTPPNILHSEQMATDIAQDVKTHLSHVKVKILNKAQMQKEKMDLFLSVNKGSAYEPRLVHLTYEPKKTTSKTKHIALVGKGLTFDTGGYSLKPGSSMMGMKFDMAGAATLYGAFRNAVLLNSPHRISCFLGITDNMVSATATVPDSIVRARSGTTVEILNTDAEGRLVLADVLDYACDFKPNIIIDAATLTGACIRALGTVCGVMGNKKSLVDKFLEYSQLQGEHSWYLPIFEEYREDMKSKIADLKNIGLSGNAGAQKAAVFLEKFVRPGIDWLHLDIAGVASDVAAIPYYPAVGASGFMVRTVTHFLTNHN